MHRTTSVLFFAIATTVTAATPPPALPSSTPPPLNAPMRQLTWPMLSDRNVSALGDRALAINPRAWYHGETENFILHYRNFSDALQVAREIEHDLWYVARSLGATREQYARKSHVYVFGDDREWQAFIKEVRFHEPWAHSFAAGEELFLNVHGTGRGFESHTVAHETTHAVVARIYARRAWPLWLGEGFADYMADACASVRRGLQPNAYPRNLRLATQTLTQILSTTTYPTDPNDVAEFYESSTKFVRYLFTKYSPQQFPQLVARIISGQPAESALVEIYGDEFRDLAAFDKEFKTQIR